MAVLCDTPTLLVRPLEPEDIDHLSALFDRLSPRSRYLRFLAPVHQLPAPVMRYLAAVDHVAHEAVGVFDADALVGVAHYFRSATDPGEAELSVEVADSHQRRGLGSLLLRELVDLGRQRGIVLLHATLLRENRAALALLRRPPWSPVVRSSGPELLVTIPLGP